MKTILVLDQDYQYDDLFNIQMLILNIQKYMFMWLFYFAYI